MAPAANAGLGATARRLLALVVLVATALLALLNPWLAVFALAGFALGWLVRSRRKIRSAFQRVGDQPGKERPADRRLALGVAGTAVVVAVAAFHVVSGLNFSIHGKGERGIVQLIPVSYSASANLETDRVAFALDEQLDVPHDSLMQFRKLEAKGRSASAAAQLLVSRLARAHWQNARFVGTTLELRRKRQSKSNDARFGRFTRRATVTLPIPGDLGRTNLAATTTVVDVVAPKYWMLSTAPPSDTKTLPGKREQRRVEQNEAGPMEAIQVELAGRLFRNALGASLLGLSLSGVVKWGVLLIFGWFEDELKKLLGGILGRLRRHRGTPPASAPPSRAAPSPPPPG